VILLLFIADKDKIIEQMRQDVINTKDELNLEVADRIFYVSADGDDNNDGRSP